MIVKPLSDMWVSDRIIKIILISVSEVWVTELDDCNSSCRYIMKKCTRFECLTLKDLFQTEYFLFQFCKWNLKPWYIYMCFIFTNIYYNEIYCFRNTPAYSVWEWTYWWWGKLRCWLFGSPWTGCLL